MSSTRTAPLKPTLTGTSTKTKKRTVNVKYEPGAFRDQLYKHLETVPADDFDAIANKLTQVGSTLAYSSYADALLEIILAGGVLQSGGIYLDDGAALSPFTILRASEPVDVEEMKKYVDVITKLLRRYPFLIKPLEEVVIPSLVQYANRWPEAQRQKFSMTVGLLISRHPSTCVSLQVLTKDHLVKDGTSMNVFALAATAFLADQPAQREDGPLRALLSTLKAGGIKDIMEFMPVNKRSLDHLKATLKEKDLVPLSDWYSKRKMASMKETILNGMAREISADEGAEALSHYIMEKKSEFKLSDKDLIPIVWEGLTKSVDLSAPPAGVTTEDFALKQITEYTDILKPLCAKSGAAQGALITSIQVWCAEDHRVTKIFPKLIFVLYNDDCLSSGIIFWWNDKGAKPQGKEQLKKSVKGLIAKIRANEEEDDD